MRKRFEVCLGHAPRGLDPAPGLPLYPGMERAELEHYLHEKIPLSKAMGVSVRSLLPDEIILAAPLEPNINHHQTFFGGSGNALAILAAWSLVHCRLKAAGFQTDLVIRRNAMDYRLPVSGEALAIATAGPGEGWQRLFEMLSRHRKGRITVRAELRSGDLVAGTFEGEFVALPAPIPVRDSSKLD